MSFNGRPTSGKLTPGADLVPSSGSMDGEQIARAVRVEELRRLVAAGRYKVEPNRLAARILERALAPRK